MKKNFLFLILIFLFSLPLVFPFFRAGYFPTDDGEWAIVRLGAMHRGLIAGQLPVRWTTNLNFGYGYPLFHYTYPLPYYLGEIFNLWQLGLVDSVKLLFILSVILSGWAMFFLAREFFGDSGGLVAAIFYLYAPFRLVDLYVRGSLGESLAFIFYPFIFLAFLKITEGVRVWIPLGSIFIGGLVLTHNISALIFMPLALGYLVYKILTLPKNKKFFVFWSSLKAVLLGIGLAAFFLFPALIEKKLIVLSQIQLANVKENFLNWRQLIFPNWGDGVPGGKDSFSFQLGWVHLFALVLTIVLSLTAKRRLNKVLFSDLIFFVFCFAVLVLLTQPASYIFWRIMPLFSAVDFPWRVLGPASFLLALPSGRLGANRHYRFAAYFLAAVSIVVNISYARPNGRINYPDDYYFTNEATTTSADELMPIWVKQKPVERASEKVEVLSGEVNISQTFYNGKKISFNLDSVSQSIVQVNSIYFPGWQVEIDGQPVKINYQNTRGLIAFEVSPGFHRVMARFKETRFWLMADITSLISLILITSLFFKFTKSR